MIIIPETPPRSRCENLNSQNALANAPRRRLLHGNPLHLTHRFLILRKRESQSGFLQLSQSPYSPDIRRFRLSGMLAKYD